MIRKIISENEIFYTGENKDREADRQTGRQTDRQTERQTNGQRPVVGRSW